MFGCLAANITSSSALLACADRVGSGQAEGTRLSWLAGFGLQLYRLPEARASMTASQEDSVELKLEFERTFAGQNEPLFVLNNLEPQTSYQVRVYALNPPQTSFSLELGRLKFSTSRSEESPQASGGSSSELGAAAAPRVELMDKLQRASALAAIASSSAQWSSDSRQNSSHWLQFKHQHQHQHQHQQQSLLEAVRGSLSSAIGSLFQVLADENQNGSRSSGQWRAPSGGSFAQASSTRQAAGVSNGRRNGANNRLMDISDTLLMAGVTLILLLSLVLALYLHRYSSKGAALAEAGRRARSKLEGRSKLRVCSAEANLEEGGNGSSSLASFVGQPSDREEGEASAEEGEGQRYRLGSVCETNQSIGNSVSTPDCHGSNSANSPASCFTTSTATTTRAGPVCGRPDMEPEAGGVLGLAAAPVSHLQQVNSGQRQHRWNTLDHRRPSGKWAQNSLGRPQASCSLSPNIASSSSNVSNACNGALATVTCSSLYGPAPIRVSKSRSSVCFESLLMGGEQAESKQQRLVRLTDIDQSLIRDANFAPKAKRARDMEANCEPAPGWQLCRADLLASCNFNHPNQIATDQPADQAANKKQLSLLDQVGSVFSLAASKQRAEGLAMSHLIEPGERMGLIQVESRHLLAGSGLCQNRPLAGGLETETNSALLPSIVDSMANPTLREQQSESRLNGLASRDLNGPKCDGRFYGQTNAAGGLQLLEQISAPACNSSSLISDESSDSNAHCALSLPRAEHFDPTQVQFIELRPTGQADCLDVKLMGELLDPNFACSNKRQHLNHLQASINQSIANGMHPMHLCPSVTSSSICSSSTRDQAASSPLSNSNTSSSNQESLLNANGRVRMDFDPEPSDTTDRVHSRRNQDSARTLNGPVSLTSILKNSSLKQRRPSQSNLHQTEENSCSCNGKEPKANREVH